MPLDDDVIALKIAKSLDNLRDCHSGRAMFRHLLHKYTIAIRMNYNVIVDKPIVSHIQSLRYVRKFDNSILL